MKLSIQIGLLSLARIALLLVSEWYILVQVGAGVEMDARVAGLIVPQFIIAIVNASISQVLVPIMAVQDDDTRRRTAWACLILSAGLTIALSIVLMLSAAQWSPLLAPGFTPAAKALLIDLTRIQLLGLAFSVSSVVLAAVYYARKQFARVEVAQLFSLLVGLAVLVWGLSTYGIYLATFVLVLRAALDFAQLLPALAGVDVRRPAWFQMSEIWQRLRHLLLGSAYYGTEPLLNQVLVSLAPPGNLSLFFAAQRVYDIPSQVTQRAVASPLLPALAGSAQRSDWIAFRRAFRQRLFWMGVYTCAAYVVFLLFGEWVLTLLVGHGQITEGNIHQLWLDLVGLGGLFVAGSLGQITVTSLYAVGDTRTPTRIGILTFTLYLPLKIWLFFNYGVLGLAVAISAFFVVNLLGQWYSIEKRMVADVAAHAQAGEMTA